MRGFLKVYVGDATYHLFFGSGAYDLCEAHGSRNLYEKHIPTLLKKKEKGKVNWIILI